MAQYYYKLDLEIIDDEIYEPEDIEQYVKEAIELHLECLIASAKLKMKDKVIMSGFEAVEA